jgi:hypothetical protein
VFNKLKWFCIIPKVSFKLQMLIISL